jgi:hypothetical protein
MSIGLSGAHRVGKSTLAKAYAERYKIAYVPTGATATYARLGLSPKVDYPFAVRLQIQKEILADCSRLYRGAPARFITDRTPLDFMAYMIADVQRNNVTMPEAKELERYIEDCYKAANAHFSTIVIVRPGIPLVEEEGKAPANPAYITHLDALMIGLGYGGRYKGLRFHIPETCTDMEERIKCVHFAETTSVERALIEVQMLQSERGALATH